LNSNLSKRRGSNFAMENKWLFVGVSPYPYRGKSYWYIDENGVTAPRTYVWARMGRHDREQIVYVDHVRWCDANNAPYPPDKAQRILRQTTKDEAEKAEESWREILD
jgi:hypothetical protein